jgi:hypothetical protein
MKLTSTQIKQVEDQIGAKPVSDDDPAVSQLTEAFGDHTFYLQEDGLHLFMPHGELEGGGQVVNMVRLARWSAEDADSLVPHAPDPTDIYVDLRPGADIAEA